MTIAIPLWFAHLATILVCGAALWKGGWEERLIGGGVGLSILFTNLARDLSWPKIQGAALAGDLLLIALAFGVALRTKKYWPLAAAAFQLLIVMTHVAKSIDPTLHQWAYVTAIVIFTYLNFIAIGVGTYNHWRVQRQQARADDDRL